MLLLCHTAVIEGVSPVSFRFRRGFSRILSSYGAVSLAFFLGLGLVADGYFPDVPEWHLFRTLLELVFVVASVAVLRHLINRRYHRLRRVNEGLEARLVRQTEALRAELEQRTRTEAMLRQSEQRFRDLAESASQWLWESGPDQRLRTVSRRFDDATGLDGGVLLEAGPEALDLGGEAEGGTLRTLLDRQQPFQDVPVRFAHQGERRQFLLSGRPLFDAAGHFAGYRGTGEDVTERHLRERAAEQLRHRHELILNGLGEGVFGLDGEGRFTFLNPAALQLLGWSGAELAEKFAAIILAPDPADGFSEAAGQAGGPRHNVRFRRKDGSWLPVDYVWTAILENGEVNGAVVAFRDITAQLQAERELIAAKERAEEATRAKSAFLAHISHQLRTPLNSIVGFADVMKNEYFGPIGNDRYKGYVDDIGLSAAHLSEVIEDLVDLARIEAGKLVLHEQQADIAALVEDALAMVRPLAGQGGCSLLNNVPGNLPPVLLDPLRFKQVLLNLLSNAVKFTPEGGRVAVMAEMEPDGGLLLQVSDTGIGIGEEDLEKVTQMFVRGDDSLSNKPGAGLGLPLAKQLMELHGGGLTLASQPQHGTVASLRLPPGRIASPVGE
ncbi:cell-division control histidine kinase PdhS [mine drainage metagenome]|uniref:histidine kinase n=1 Tax=mine drainage metagenome TaxID=410659 RepID=A0A1J5RYN6_9ZZZZ